MSPEPLRNIGVMPGNIRVLILYISLLLTTGALVTTAALYAQNRTPASPTQAAPHPMPGQLVSPHASMPEVGGRELFITNRCVRCHTIGRGRFVGPDLAGVGKRYSEMEIVQWMTDPQGIYGARGKMPVNDGFPPMPPLGVGEGNARKIAKYVLGFKPRRSRSDRRGVIEGVVVNGSTEQPEWGVEVELKAYMGDRETDGREGKTDKKGRFSFKGLAWNRSYVVTLEHDGSVYESDKMVFFPEEDKKSLELAVYDPTTSSEEIRVGAQHLIFEVGPDSASVAEIIVVRNGGNKVYVGTEHPGGEKVDKRPTLSFPVPAGAMELTFIQGIERRYAVRTSEGISDTLPFTPGVKRVVFTYRLPLKSGVDISRRLKYPTDNFTMLVSETDNEVSVEGLTQGASIEVEGQRYLSWGGTGLGAGHTISVKIKAPFRAGEHMGWYATAIVLVVLCIGVFRSFRKGGAEAAIDEGQLLKALEYERLKLIMEIARLDAEHEAGEIKQSVYSDARREKKARAIEITAEIKRKLEQ